MVHHIRLLVYATIAFPLAHPLIFSSTTSTIIYPLPKRAAHKWLSSPLVYGKYSCRARAIARVASNRLSRTQHDCRRIHSGVFIHHIVTGDRPSGARATGHTAHLRSVYEEASPPAQQQRISDHHQCVNSFRPWLDGLSDRSHRTKSAPDDFWIYETQTKKPFMHSGVCLCVTYNWLVSHFQTCSSNVRRLLILHSALRQPSALLLIPIHIIYRIIRIFSLVVCLARAQSTTKRTHKSIPDRLSSSQLSGASRYARGSRCPTHSLCRLFLFRARACPAIVVGAPKHVNYIYVFIHVGHLGRAGFCWFVVCQTARRMPHTISLSPFYIIISVQRARSS